MTKTSQDQNTEDDARSMFILTSSPRAKDKSFPDEVECEWRIETTARGVPVPDTWSTGPRKKGINQGDVLVLLKQGENSGIIAIGRAAGQIYTNQNENWVDVEWTLWLDQDDRLPIERLREIAPKRFAQPIQRSGWLVSDPTEAAAVLHEWESRHGSLPAAELAISGNDVAEAATFLEGERLVTSCTRFSRSREARDACLETYGYGCSVCEMSFGDRYGEFASEYIHVHHLTPLAHNTSGKARPVSPEGDLRPVCANCHFMLHHKTDPPRTIEDLQALMSQAPEAQ